MHLIFYEMFRIGLQCARNVTLSKHGTYNGLRSSVTY